MSVAPVDLREVEPRVDLVLQERRVVANTLRAGECDVRNETVARTGSGRKVQYAAGTEDISRT